jgi:hypothetical protein
MRPLTCCRGSMEPGTGAGCKLPDVGSIPSNDRPGFWATLERMNAARVGTRGHRGSVSGAGFYRQAEEPAKWFRWDLSHVAASAVKCARRVTYSARARF